MQVTPATLAQPHILGFTRPPEPVLDPQVLGAPAAAGGGLGHLALGDRKEVQRGRSSGPWPALHLQPRLLGTGSRPLPLCWELPPLP